MDNQEPKFTDICFVSFTDDHITKVAEHAGVSKERVREYLDNDEDQDSQLFKAFGFVTGIYPIRKHR